MSVVCRQESSKTAIRRCELTVAKVVKGNINIRYQDLHLESISRVIVRDRMSGKILYTLTLLTIHPISTGTELQGNTLSMATLPTL